jgi:hypothetical protein
MEIDVTAPALNGTSPDVTKSSEAIQEQRTTSGAGRRHRNGRDSGTAAAANWLISDLFVLASFWRAAWMDTQVSAAASSQLVSYLKKKPSTKTRNGRWL